MKYEVCNMAEIGIVLGSDSDLPKIKGCFDLFDKFEVTYELTVCSAHRTPEKAIQWATSAKDKGLKVIIAVAGGAAHLPGVIASHTTIPVIGVPIETKLAGGLDSILSILQMPSGVPVATMPTGKAGGVNAALYALHILAITDEMYSVKLWEYRQEMAQGVEEKNNNLNKYGYHEYIRMLEEKK